MNADSTGASADASEPALPAESSPQMTQPLPLTDEENRVVGHVKWQIYQSYMKAIGTGLVLFVMLSLTLMQVQFCHVPKLPLHRCLILS